MQEVGLAADLIDNPEAHIPATRIADLLHAGVKTSRRADFPLFVAQAYQPSMIGTVALSARRQPTVGKGLEVYEQRLKDWNNTFSIKISRLKDVVIFQPVLLDPSLQGDTVAIDLVMGFSLRALRWLLGESWWPDLACFARAAPADAAAHRRLFGQVEFEHDFNGLIVDAQMLNRPIGATDPGLEQAVARHAAANALHAGSSTTEQILELVARLLPTGACTVDLAARHMGVDRRTVHRRLAAEGHSFTELVDQMRRDLIIDRIGDRTRSLTEIAGLLGFSSLSTFSRWHRTAFGAAARDFRRSRTSPAYGPPNAP